MQACLFCGGDANEPGHLTRCDGRQGRLEARLPPREAVNLVRDQRMEEVAQAAERYTPDFQLLARACVTRYLAQHGPTSGEVLTLACRAAGIVPHDDRAFGPVYYALARQRIIEKVGSQRRERGHGTAGGNVWALTSTPGETSLAAPKNGTPRNPSGKCEVVTGEYRAGLKP